MNRDKHSVQHVSTSRIGVLGFCVVVLLIIGLAVPLVNGAPRLLQNERMLQNEEIVWAFEETFDGDPDSPSQDLLPRNFNYVVTHRTHAQEQFTKPYKPYLADHDDNCVGPNPDINPLPQHLVYTDQASSNTNPDQSFFICKNHMMTALGEVDPYSVNAFWPRQEFDFSDGGVLEFEVNINRGHTVRSWWEIMIVPRDQIRLGAGPSDSPIDEAYPDDRIVLEFRRLTRGIKVGTEASDPEGWLVNERDFGDYDYNYWYALHPNDPALTDRRIRRTMRITLQDEEIIWSIETEDGSFDDYAVEVPGGLPFTRGLVMFKTHAYTPEKDGNYDTYTFHWDNIRFDGPVVGLHDAYDADNVVYLQRNGDRPIGDTQTVAIDLPRVEGNPVLIGQVNQPMTGQVLLTINGETDLVVHPDRYDRDNCISDDWKTFRIELDPAWLVVGQNSLKWTVGPNPGCATGEVDWDGYSIKALQIQMDLEGDDQITPIPTSPAAPEPSVTPQPTDPTDPTVSTPEPQPTEPVDPYPGPPFGSETRWTFMPFFKR